MHAPSAARNAEAICDLVAAHAPQQGRALEIASGTGQHTVALARRLPGLKWQPSDIDAGRQASVDAWARSEALDNIAPAIMLNATVKGWGEDHGDQDLVLLSNLLHLIPEHEARVLIAETAKALAVGGIFVLYGPFLRDGETTSPGDAEFNTNLQAQDPEIGYKDDWDVIDWIHESFLELVQVVEMPSNNLAFVSRRVG
jgi:SAM-dependent methyltransferase